MKVGLDLEKIKRFKIEKNDPFIIENFTKKEIIYCYSKTKPEESLCGIFCAKEAAIKCNNKLKIKDIEITHNNSGEPALEIDDKYKYLLSITHSEDYAAAVVILTKDE